MGFQKEMIIEDIKKDKYFIQLVKDNNLSIDDINNNLLILYSYLLKKNQCEKCISCDECAQHYVHKCPVLTYSEHFNIEYKDCEKYLKANSNNNYLENLIEICTDLKNINEQDLFRVKAQRNEVYSKLKQITINLSNNIPSKGLYLYGSYGCGKSYIMGVFAKHFAKMGFQTIFAFYPELVRIIKASIGTGRSEEYIELLKYSDILIIDDFGGEVSTSWIRDEVLFPILQYRMEKHLLTFMTSNLDPNTLHDHLAETKESCDETKAWRIEERIKTLMEFIELKDNNYRL